MDALITNVWMEKDKWNEINVKKQTIGVLYSQDRYYTWLNTMIDYRLKNEHKFLFIIISFLMRSTNFKHNTSFIFKRPFWVLLIDILCWIAMISFFIFLATGFAAPIIRAISETIKFVTKPDNKDIVAVWTQAFSSSKTIVSLVFSLITLIIGIVYLYVMTKIIPKNKGLNIKDYVNKKIDYIIRFSSWIKTEEKINKNITNKIKKQIIGDNVNDYSNLIIIDNLNILLDADKWLSIQVLNTLYLLFFRFKVTLILRGIDEDTFRTIKKIIFSDFKFSQIYEIDSETNMIVDSELNNEYTNNSNIDSNLIDWKQFKKISLKSKKPKKRTNNRKLKTHI